MTSCRFAGAAVDDELLGTLRDLRVEVVEEHSKRRLGRPRACVQLCAARRTNARQTTAERLDQRVERARRGHVRPRSSSRSRSRQRLQLHAVATTKKNAPITTARTRLPPVAAAATTSRAA